MKTPLHILLAATFLVTVPAMAQIPNAGFENWITVGSYQDPVQWTTINQTTTSQGAGLSCEKGTPGAVGNSYVKLTSLALAGVGVIPGQLSAVDANGMTGFPYAARPEALNGMWKHAIQTGDAGFITVTLTKFNTTSQSDEAVGVGSISVAGTQAAWQSFSMPITYISSDMPDKAIILIMSSAGSGIAGSTLSLDELGFGNFTGIDEPNALPELTVRPTLATDLLTVTTAIPMAELTILDLSGRSVKTMSTGQAQVEMHVSDLPVGRYLLGVRMADGRRNMRSFVKQ